MRITEVPSEAGERFVLHLRHGVSVLRALGVAAAAASAWNLFLFASGDETAVEFLFLTGTLVISLLLSWPIARLFFDDVDITVTELYVDVSCKKRKMFDRRVAIEGPTRVSSAVCTIEKRNGKEKRHTIFLNDETKLLFGLTSAHETRAIVERLNRALQERSLPAPELGEIADTVRPGEVH